MASHTDGHGSSWIFGQAPDAWLDGYKALIGASQVIAERWLSNRAAQLQSGLEAWGKLAGSKDVGEMIEIQQRWMRDTAAGAKAEMDAYQAELGSLTKDSFARFAQAPSAPASPSRAA